MSGLPTELPPAGPARAPGAGHGAVPMSPLVRHVRYQRQQTPFPDPFTRDELEAIIDDLTERYADGVANAVEFKSFSGLRPSETTAPGWADVDLDAGARLA